MSTNPTITQSQHHKIMAALLALLSLVSIYAMLHHPSVSAHDIHEQIQEVNLEASLNTFVHGVLIAFVMMITVCLTYYAKTRGFHRSSILFGAILYWVGTIVMVFAALMSGIVGPLVAEFFQQANDTQAEVFRGVFMLTHYMNQAFAYFSVFCWCAAIGCWAFDMFRQSHIIKIFGYVSLLGAIMISASLLFDWIGLGVFGMTVILIVISAWQLGIAVMLFKQPDSAE